MYCRVPRICPLLVSASVSVASASVSGALCLARPKSSSLIPCLVSHQDIGGLQIAMRDSLAMRRIERVQNLPGVFDGLLDWQRTLKRRPLDELHHQVVGTDVVK